MKIKQLYDPKKEKRENFKLTTYIEKTREGCSLKITLSEREKVFLA